jgi:competence protein ComGD
VNCTNENGFTFIELILVLAVLSTITAIILPVGDKWIQSNRDEDALHSLVATIHSLQSYSLANEVLTQLTFRDSGTMYISSASGKGTLARDIFPPGMRVASSSPMKAVEFKTNGDIVNSGTLTIQSKSGITQIRFQFQRGRMIISE